MQVVRPVEGVEVQWPRALDELPIRLHRKAVRRDGRVVVTAEDVEVARHVLEVARIRDESPQPVRAR